MSLRTMAEADLAFTLEDPLGFGWPVVVTDSEGTSKSLNGSSTDIMQMIDPDTGTPITGRTASVTLRIATLESATPGPALSIPVGKAKTTVKPWTVVFQDINLVSHTFKIAQTAPDRALGVVVCFLEYYTAL